MNKMFFAALIGFGLLAAPVQADQGDAAQVLGDCVIKMENVPGIKVPCSAVIMTDQTQTWGVSVIVRGYVGITMINIVGVSGFDGTASVVTFNNADGTKDTQSDPKNGLDVICKYETVDKRATGFCVFPKQMRIDFSSVLGPINKG